MQSHHKNNLLILSKTTLSIIVLFVLDVCVDQTAWLSFLNTSAFKQFINSLNSLKYFNWLCISSLTLIFVSYTKGGLYCCYFQLALRFLPFSLSSCNISSFCPWQEVFICFLHWPGPAVVVIISWTFISLVSGVMKRSAPSLALWLYLWCFRTLLKG